MRTIKTELNSPVPQNSVDNLVMKLQKNPEVAPDNIRLTFTLNSEKEKEKPRTFIAYLYPDLYKDRIVGRSISQKNIASQTPVMISGNEDLNFNPAARHFHTGDYVDLDGIKFSVIGCYNSIGESGEIPYTVGLSHFTLTELQLLLPADTTDNQKERLGDYLKSLIPNGKVTLPQPLTQKVLMNMFIPFAAAFIIGISALVNLLFIFKYMLESSQEDYFVLKICGCGNHKLFSVLFSELVLLYTLSYLAGEFLFSKLRQVFRENTLFVNSQLDASPVVIVYLVSVLLIVLVMVPYLMRYHKQVRYLGGTR